MKKDDRYYGPLTEDQTINGIKLCYENALALYNDAQILLNANRRRIAVFSLLTCLEELSKPQLLAMIYRTPAELENTRKRRWNNFYSHSYKQGSGLGWKYLSSAKNLSEVMTLATSALEGGNILSGLREEILYIGYSKETMDWKTPREVIDEEVTELYRLTTESLERMRVMIADGIFSKPALLILKEHYENVERAVEGKTSMNLDDLRELGVLKINAEYYEKLKAIGIIVTGNLNQPVE